MRSCGIVSMRNPGLVRYSSTWRSGNSQHAVVCLCIWPRAKTWPQVASADSLCTRLPFPSPPPSQLAGIDVDQCRFIHAGKTVPIHGVLCWFHRFFLVFGELRKQGLFWCLCFVVGLCTMQHQRGYLGTQLWLWGGCNGLDFTEGKFYMDTLSLQ